MIFTTENDDLVGHEQQRSQPRDNILMVKKSNYQ